VNVPVQKTSYLTYVITDLPFTLCNSKNSRLGLLKISYSKVNLEICEILGFHGGEI